MPYKEVGAVKNASIYAVLNMEVRAEGVYVCVYGTGKYDRAEVVVTNCGTEIFREETTLSPVDIFEKTIPASRRVPAEGGRDSRACKTGGGGKRPGRDHDE